MITFTGPMNRKEAAELRKFVKLSGIKGVARCKHCGCNTKQFEHMALMRFVPFRNPPKISDVNYTKGVEIGFLNGFVGTCVSCLDGFGPHSLVKEAELVETFNAS